MKTKFLIIGLLILPILVSCAPAPAARGYLSVSVTYSLAQLGESATLVVTHEETSSQYAAASTERDIPALAVLFRDGAGRVVGRQTLPVVEVRDYLVIDGGLVIEWAVDIPDDPRYVCVELESNAALPLTNYLTSKIESPLVLCGS